MKALKQPYREVPCGEEHHYPARMRPLPSTTKLGRAMAEVETSGLSLVFK
jgi:hypothetical protein